MSRARQKSLCVTKGLGAINLGSGSETLREGLLKGDRRALAKAITLAESANPDHRAQAESLLTSLPTTEKPTLRVGLSGTPGVGKSSFIEALGTRLTAAGHKVAVLAVDPSSARSGGSILGDKTRMERLARDPNAFIRPSPAGTQLGGVARRTRDVIALVEAAGFDIVIVETVGVGQSETLVAEMTDIFVLLLAPAGGDELQGVKRGIMEIADIILINKADGALEAQARATCADYQAALHLMRKRSGDPQGYPCARTVSADTGAGLSAAWETVERLAQARRDSGRLEANRADQREAAFAREREAALIEHLSTDPDLQQASDALLGDVRDGSRAPSAAAAALIRHLFSRRS